MADNRDRENDFSWDKWSESGSNETGSQAEFSKKAVGRRLRKKQWMRNKAKNSVQVHRPPQIKSHFEWEFFPDKGISGSE